MHRSTSRRGFLVGGAQALGAGSLVGLIGPGARVHAQEKAEKKSGGTPSAEAIAYKAVEFLKGRQEPNGGWSTARGPGITGVVVTSLLRSKQVTPADPAVTKGLAYLEGFIGKDGGLGDVPQANYVTSIAMMAFHEANVRGRYDKQIAAAQRYLKTLQWDESEQKGKDDPFYGGAGYGGKSRPDLSNTTFFMEALRETGLPPDDPNLQKALLFVSRCQNLKSEFNDQPWAGKVNDGGFIYTAANGGSSMAGEEPGGGLRSYASMTYAGLKSMIYAGLAPNDPRVKAALEYIRKHYTLDENPGMGQAGLYYYYQTFAKALALMGQKKVVDESGQSHDWRAELTAALAKRQHADGSWVNPADRFMEGDPNLVTAYGLLALGYARPEKP